MRMIAVGLSVALLSAVTISCSQNSDAAKQNAKRYGIKSGMVEYELSGMQSGKETIWFDSWGMREAKLSETTVKVMGFSRSQSQLTLTEGEWVTSVDLKNNSGTRMKNPMFAELSGQEKRDLRELGEEMMERMGGKKIGTEKILGKTCDVWEVAGMGSKTWIWNSIPLKSEVNMGPMKQTTVATRLVENAKIPEEKFQLASDISIAEAPANAGADLSKLMQNMQQGQN